LFTVFGLFKTNLFTVHDGLYYQNNAIKNKKAIFWIIEKILYRRCSFVHFISYFTKDQSLYGARKNYKVIPNSSNLESLIDTTLYNHLNLPKNYVLIVKSFEERARFDLLMDVARRLKNTSFVVAGKGPLLGFYQSYIEKNDIHNVKILGYVDDITLINLYRQCSTVMNIAEYGEGFGLPIIEGYLFNKPVIASDKCAIPEVIISVEFLFENNAESIIKVYEKTLNLLTKDYKSFYDLRYSNEIISKQLNILYHSL
jgi:glycosyltransferase involved in cell wall biosynthesis